MPPKRADDLSVPIPEGWKDDVEIYDKEKAKENAVIPGEITSRRQRKVSKEDAQKVREEFVSTEWDDVFPKKPKERLRWLDKALKGVREGRLKVTKVFDIIAHRKFLEGLKGQIATDTLNLIRGNLDIFSAKQQKQLTSDNFELFRKYAPINVLDSDDDEDAAPPLPPPPKVVIEPKVKRRKGDGGGESNSKRDREESEGNSEDELEVKRARLLSKGVERRIDPADGQAYTLEEFIAEYGGSAGSAPEEWHKQKHTSFIFKS